MVLKTKLNYFFKKEAGISSILFIILALTFILVVATLADAIGEKHAYDSIQSMLDTSATSIIKLNVNQDDLNAENITENSFNKDEIVQELKDRISEYNSTLSNNSSYKIVSETITPTYTEAAYELNGITSGRHPQFVLDTTVAVQYKTITPLMRLGTVQKTFMRTLGNEAFTASYSNANTSNNVVFFIRSVSRVVYQ